MKTALIAGSTGLVGKELLDLLLLSSSYGQVIALTRRPLGIAHPKLTEIIVDLETLSNHRARLKADDVFCCIGTTMAKAGSKEKFFAADYTYPLRLAEVSKENGAGKYLLVSALGADEHSAIYYNKVKGQVEKAIAALGFEAFHIIQPSLLLGERGERRIGEEIGKLFFKVFGFLVPSKFKAIEARQVATAMLYFAAQNSKGILVHPSQELRKVPANSSVS